MYIILAPTVSCGGVTQEGWKVSLGSTLPFKFYYPLCWRPWSFNLFWHLVESRSITPSRTQDQIPSRLLHVMIIYYLKGQSSEILIPFFTYIDGPTHKYKPLRVLKFFEGPQDFTSEMSFLVRLRRIYLEKIIFFGNFFYKQQKPISEYFSYRIDLYFGNLFLKHKKVQAQPRLSEIYDVRGAHQGTVDQGKLLKNL